jgi:hypothetical protein
MRREESATRAQSDSEVVSMSDSPSTRRTATVAPVKKAASAQPQRSRIRTKEIPPDKIGKGGNTGLLTVALADRLIGVLKTGVPLDVAIAYVGVHRETLRKWRRRGDKALELRAGRRSPTERRYGDFVQRLDAALAETTVFAQEGLRMMMAPPQELDPATGELRAAPQTDADKRIQLEAIKFYLSRRERKHYGARHGRRSRRCSAGRTVTTMNDSTSQLPKAVPKASRFSPAIGTRESENSA